MVMSRREISVDKQKPFINNVHVNVSMFVLAQTRRSSGPLTELRMNARHLF